LPIGEAYSPASRQHRRFSTPGPVAQLVEQGTFNPKVAGSSPARPINKSLLKPINVARLDDATRRRF
jgi:hypothetical protein